MMTLGLTRRLTMVAAVAGLALGAATATPASAISMQFKMFDHPDRQKKNEAYGLRLDREDPDTFFSAGANAGASTVTLTYDLTALTFMLEGTMVRSLDGSIWDLSYGMDGLTPGTDGPDVDFGAFASSSLIANSLTCADILCLGESPIEVGRKARADDLFFAFGATSDFSPGSNNDEFGVVRGNIMTATGWVGGSGTNDFLFAGTVVPLPAPLLLLGSALLGLGFLSRRRAAV